MTRETETGGLWPQARECHSHQKLEDEHRQELETLSRNNREVSQNLGLSGLENLMVLDLKH